MSKVVYFEIPVDDPDRAAGFYRDALGWEISRFGDEPYWLVRAGEARNRAPTARLSATATCTGASSRNMSTSRASGRAIGAKCPLPS